MKHTVITQLQQEWEVASRIAAGSALARRRARATHALATMQSRRRSWRPLFISLVCIWLLAFATQQVDLRRRHPRDCALPPARTTQPRPFDRFHWEHTLKTGDTLWGLADYYYGSGSAANLRRIQAANPDMPDNPRKFEVEVLVKIPVQFVP